MTCAHKVCESLDQNGFVEITCIDCLIKKKKSVKLFFLPEYAFWQCPSCHSVWNFTMNKFITDN